MKTILVTGGAGYIGSHTCVRLLESGYDVIIMDSLANSHSLVMDRLAAITGREPLFVETDLRDTEILNGVPVPHRITARRPGDVAVCYADAGKARQVLGWEARLGIEDMVRDAWNWQCGNPNGYRGGMVPMDWRKVEMEVEQRR